MIDTKGSLVATLVGDFDFSSLDKTVYGDVVVICCEVNGRGEWTAAGKKTKTAG